MPLRATAQDAQLREARTAIVTGAASGIGRAVAERLLADGYALGVCDIDPAVEQVFAAQIASGMVVAVTGDLSDGEVREELVERTCTAFGGIDALVNNAASGGEAAPVARLDLEALRRTLDVNVVSVIGLTQLAIPALERSGQGRIVNLGSLFGDEPVVGGAPYCASKGAVHTLTRVLAAELGSAGITCNTVAPGYILTPMHAEEVAFQAAERGIAVDRRYAELRAQVPLQRHGLPEDIAGAVAWLLGQDSAYVTGQRIAVNGGVQFG